MDFTREVLAEYEDVRRSGQCNMVDERCVENVARARGFHSLLRIINQGRYAELLSQYDREEAERAYEQTGGDFDITGGL